MNKELVHILLGLLCVTLLPGCASTNQISLQTAVEQTCTALSTAYHRAEDEGGSWGLKPAEITLVYDISNQKNFNGDATLAAPPTSGVSILGVKLGASSTTRRGSQIIMKFTQGGRPPNP